MLVCNESGSNPGPRHSIRPQSYTWESCTTLSNGRLFSLVLVYLNSVRLEGNPFPEDIKRKYAISYVLGAGGFGEVSLIFEKETCMKFALKKITKRPNQLKYISRETDILRKLDHVSE
uniref:Protein kinase domain-containing protein n=1 Tax=Timema poppense TaxID=170557 RepID=A0A7R9DRE3_TIMPO|nr:unnamed protein product [Timema poppensis]